MATFIRESYSNFFELSIVFLEDQGYWEYLKQRPAKRSPIGQFFWEQFSFTVHGPLMRIKIVVCGLTARPKVGQYSEAVLVMCITIVQCTYKFGN